MDGLQSGPFEDRTLIMESLRDSIKRGLFLVSVSSSTDAIILGPKYLYHHAKLYISDKKTAVVSSSNMTWQGLVASREAGIAVTDPDDVNYFVDMFDAYYEKAEPIGEELLEAIEEWLKIYSPFEIYIRSLLELYGLPSDEPPGRLPELAGYQRPVVSRILRNIEEFGGSMLVASTGLGKTVMAAHVAAYLRMENIIDQAIVLSPAGLRSMWRRTMRAARISSSEFSYHTLSAEDWKANRHVEQLESELRGADERTLVLLDESHHMRNKMLGAETRLRNRRILDSAGRQAKILLMTATPYSRGVKDINSQLELLPEKESMNLLFNVLEKNLWSVNTPAELSETANCVVLTAPSVVRHFSGSDENGERFVVFSGNERRYFPRKMHIKNIKYKNQCDDILAELFTRGLVRIKEDELKGPSLFGNTGGRRDPLLESRLVHQFCSSIAIADTNLERMSRDGGYEKTRFQNQDDLTDAVFIMRKQLSFLFQSGTSDEKLESVVKIINDHHDRKIVVFCVYIETSKYILSYLAKAFPDKKIETTAGQDGEALEKIIQGFAPESNKLDIASYGMDEDDDTDDAERIDILVATGAMSEGFNLQDASVLVNFDLPWTVLVLAQRMGRILRPWHEPREIYIYNLIPGTMEDERLRLALNWKERLDNRNREFKSFSDIPVLVDGESAFEMFDLAASMSRFGDTALNLDQVLEFIEKAGELKTTSFIDDLSILSESEMAKLRRLPDGIKSVKKTTMSRKSVYILFKYKNRPYPVIFDMDKTIMMNSDKSDDIMNIIRSSREEEASMFDINRTELDSWLELCRVKWAADRNVAIEECIINCFMILVP